MLANKTEIHINTFKQCPFFFYFENIKHNCYKLKKKKKIIMFTSQITERNGVQK